MSDWKPATEAEAAMRDALAASDQELYFRILSQTEMLLPVSEDALAGRAPMGWGTWTTGNRTHVLAFTSPTAIRVCLNDTSGSFRGVPFHALAAEWPNYEWWLAVNPGLPIESYLPSWFVSQLTRGDVRLPGRGATGTRSRVSQSDLTAALNGRIRATNPAGPAPVATASAPISHGPGGFAPPHDPSIETVDAEIIDLPSDGQGATGASAGNPMTGGPAGPYQFASPDFPPPASGAPSSDTAAASAGRFGTPAAPGGFEPYPGSPPHRAPVAAVTGPAPTTYPRPDGGSYGSQPQSGPYGGHPGPSPGFGAGMFDEPTIVNPLRPAGSSAGSPGSTSAPGSTSGPGSMGSAGTSGAGGRMRDTHDAEIVDAVGPSAGKPAGNATAAPGFVPANETESSLLAAAQSGNTDAFLSTLLLARIIVPVPPGTPPGSHPRDRSFPWRIDSVNGNRTIAVFTSPERLSEHSHSRYGREMDSVSLRFVQLIGAWPEEEIGFAINPGSPVGATLPGSQIVALASWAVEVGLRDSPAAELVVAPKKVEGTPASVAGAPAAGADRATVMQRTVPPAQVPFYVERGYDRVSGFVNRASEVSHLTSPKSLYRALGLIYPGSPFADDDAEVHVLRWIGHRADLYRLPYGGQHEAAMRAMQGWVVERAPFRGNGFAPSDTDVVAEFKVDSIRLPHGAQLWRLARDGSATLVATFDADATRWVPPKFGLGGSYA